MLFSVDGDIYVWWTHNIFFISFGRWVNVSESINALDVNGLSSSEDAKSIDKKKNIKNNSEDFLCVNHQQVNFRGNFWIYFREKSIKNLD